MQRFLKLPEGIVRDQQRTFHDADDQPYQLEWSPTLSQDRTTFAESAKLAEACELAGSGWRMPQMHELASLVDYSRFNPAIDTDAFPDTKPNWYWTGTVDASSPSDYAWGVNFLDGYVCYHPQNDGGFVRACRRVSPGQ